MEGVANFAKKYPDNVDVDTLQKTIILLQNSPVDRVEESLTGRVKQVSHLSNACQEFIISFLSPMRNNGNFYNL